MGLSRKHLSENFVPVHFDPEELSSVLQERLPLADFCLLMGSAANGTVPAFSDLDLAVYCSQKPTYEFYSKAVAAVCSAVPGVRADIGILNDAEPVYRFEALKGRLLFARNPDRYAAFFSLTCREYESQLFDYEKQLRYRKEAAHAV